MDEIMTVFIVCATMYGYVVYMEMKNVSSALKWQTEKHIVYSLLQIRVPSKSKANLWNLNPH